MRYAFRILSACSASLLVLTLLSACGGGGGGGSGDQSGQGSGGGSGGNTTNSQGSAPANGSASVVANKFNLSGTITVTSGSAADSDVNDPLAFYADNNSTATAQFVPTYVTLGGYVNEPGAGPAGRSKAPGDLTDMYQVTLAAGQSVTLHIAADGVVNDLDLYLTDLNGDQVFTSAGRAIRSIGQTDLESLSAESTGSYIVVVTAHAGAARYLLSIGQSLGSTTASAAAEPDYISGEVLVELTEGFRALGGAWLGSALADGLGMTADGGGAQPTLRFSLNAATPRKRYWEDFGLGHLLEAGAIPTHPSPARQIKLDTALLAKSLSRRSWVRSVALNYVRQPQLVPNDPLYSQQWHYEQIHLAAAWDNVPASSDVIVAVADTGVLLDHPDLAGRFVDGYDFVSSVSSAADGDGVDPDPSDPGDRAVPGASTYHGTHVAGTIGAATNNGVGVAGVAWNATLMPLRVIGRAGATDFDLIQALRYAARLSNVSGSLPARRADVINLSLGGPGLSQILANALRDVRNAGVIIVASAGNNSTNAPHYPAAAEGVIGVSALDYQENLATYSNFGSYVDVAAPGGNLLADLNSDGEPDGVLSTRVDDTTTPVTPTYDYRQGTSMAAPHVSGVIALMLSLRPATTPDDIDAYLAAGVLTQDLGIPGRDDLFGYGRIDALKAVNAATMGPPPPLPELSVDPTALNFSVSLATATVAASNGGGGALTGVAATSNAAWLTVAPQAVDAEGLGDYAVSVDRTGLANGVYMSDITFTSSQNTESVSVIMQVATGMDLSNNAGHHFVVLLDEESLENVAEIPVDAEQGSYDFTLVDVPEGNYYLVAGSDADNDQSICTSSEACGVFGNGNGNGATVIHVDRNMTDLDFTTQFLLAPAALGSALQTEGVGRAGTRR